jgi:hypothetical protein
MYFFTQPLVDYIIHVYRSTDFTNPATADAFFGIFTPGNTVLAADRPYERFNDYEELLQQLKAADAQKYDAMHKGTPFYYLSWLAFELQRFETALFYVDAAISEDIRKAPGTWQDHPGTKFFLLAPGGHVADRTVTQLRAILDAQIERFNSLSARPRFGTYEFTMKFFRLFGQDIANRSIVTAFYVFLYEFRARYRELGLRSHATGGSSLPFILHLLKGGLIVESLLKHFYPNNGGIPNETIGAVFQTRQFLREFLLAASPHTRATTLAEIYVSISGNTVLSAFSTTAKLRNTTGHNVVWDDVFDDPEQYRRLFEQEMNAIFYLLTTKIA